MYIESCKTLDMLFLNIQRLCLRNSVKYFNVDLIGDDKLVRFCSVAISEELLILVVAN